MYTGISLSLHGRLRSTAAVQRKNAAFETLMRFRLVATKVRPTRARGMAWKESALKQQTYNSNRKPCSTRTSSIWPLVSDTLFRLIIYMAWSISRSCSWTTTA